MLHDELWGASSLWQLHPLQRSHLIMVGASGGFTQGQGFKADRSRLEAFFTVKSFFATELLETYDDHVQCFILSLKFCIYSGYSIPYSRLKFVECLLDMAAA